MSPPPGGERSCKDGNEVRACFCKIMLLSLSLALPAPWPFYSQLWISSVCLSIYHFSCISRHRSLICPSDVSNIKTTRKHVCRNSYLLAVPQPST